MVSGSFSNEDLNSFRVVLRQLQKRIRGDVAQLEEDVFSGRESEHTSTNHMAEMGTDASEADLTLRMVENDEVLLKDISTALEKIEAGTFGQCEMCLEAGVAPEKARIPKARLREIPYARNCVRCERRRENDE